MKLPGFLQKALTADPDWVDPFRAEAKSQFDFLPTNSAGWPIAEWSSGLRDFAVVGGMAPGSYSTIYRSQPSVYTVVEFLAWQISQIGLKVYQRQADGEKTPLQDSPITALFGEPATGLTYEKLMHTTVADLCVFGNAYWLKLEQGPDRIVVPIRPQWVTPQGGNLIEAKSYRIATGGTQKEYDRDQVLHFRRHNPDDARIGVSPLEPLRQIIAEEREASADRVGFWRNAARIEGFLLHPTKLSDEAYERLRASFQQTYSGAANSGKTAILEEGTDFKSSSFSPKDSEFIAGRKLTLETVARAFNIPVSVLGLTDTATFASQKEFHKALYQDTLGPWLKMLEGEIKRGIVRWFTSDKDTFVEFNIAEKLKGSFEEQADALRSWVGVPPMSVNEWRARYNLPRIPDPVFDNPVHPANIIYGGVGGNGTQPMPADVAAGADATVVNIKEHTS